MRTMRLVELLQIVFIHMRVPFNKKDDWIVDALPGIEQLRPLLENPMSHSDHPSQEQRDALIHLRKYSDKTKAISDSFTATVEDLL